MDIFGDVVEFFDTITILLGVGAIVVAVSVNDRWKYLLVVAALIGAVGALVFAAGQPDKVTYDVFGWWVLYGIGAGIGLAVITRFLLTLDNKAGTFAIFGQIGEAARTALAPRRWPEAKGKPPVSRRDLVKRCIVAIAGATGGVVGTLMSLDLFWSSLKESFDINGLFHSIFFSVVSIMLVVPLHEVIIDHGLDTKRHAAPAEDKSIFDDISWLTLGRLGLVAILFVALDLTSASLAACVRQGKIAAMYAIVLGGLVPGLVSYYWCAAVQLEVPSVRKSATWPSIVAGAAIFSGMGFALAVASADRFGVWGGSDSPSGGVVWAILLYLLFVTVAVSLFISAVTCGVFAAAGSYAIDRVRHNHSLVALFVALLIGSVPPTIALNAFMEFSAVRSTQRVAAACPSAEIHVFDFLALTAHAAESEPAPVVATAPASPCDQTGFTLINRFNVIFAAIGWFIGLWASGFALFVRQRRHAISEEQMLPSVTVQENAGL